MEFEKIEEGAEKKEKHKVYATFFMDTEVIKRLNKYTEDKSLKKSRLINNILSAYLEAKGY